MSTTLVLADTVLTLDPAGTIHQPGYLVIEDDRLVEVGRADRISGRSFDREVRLDHRLVMPGLVNAHTHTPMVLFRGMVEPYSLFTFEGWYEGIRTLEAVLDSDMIPPAVAVSCAEMIRTGTTCFADQYFFMDRVVPVVRESGLRAVLAYGIVEMGSPEAREREMASAARFLESVRGEPRITGWVGPHAFFVDNSLEAIRMELDLAGRYSAGLHIHLATSGEEERFCRENYGRSAVQQMETLGILDRRLLAAHCITIPAGDFPTLAQHPFTAVVAPCACMRSGAEIAPLKAMRAAGVNTAIGTDNVANNNSYDLFKEMRAAAQLMAQREHQPNALTAQEILEMATIGGARALGLADQIGSLEPGKKADLISLDLDEIGWTPAGGQSLYTALVHSINGQYVRDSMVDGSWLFRDNRWTGLDYPAARAALDRANADLRSRLNR